MPLSWEDGIYSIEEIQTPGSYHIVMLTTRAATNSTEKLTGSRFPIAFKDFR